MESEIPRESQETLSSAKNVSPSLPFSAAAFVAKARSLSTLSERDLQRLEKDSVDCDTRDELLAETQKNLGVFNEFLQVFSAEIERCINIFSAKESG